jgi:hypothetical protein
MKKWAVFLILIGSGLAAYGISGWQLYGTVDRYFSAGWPLNSQIEIVIGVASLAYGLILNKDSK